MEVSGQLDTWPLYCWGKSM